MKKILVLGLISLFVFAMSTGAEAKIGYGPVVLDDATVVEQGTGEVAGGIGYASNNETDLKMLTLLGIVSYGVTEKLDVEASIPYVSYSNGVDESGLSDISVGAKYALLTGDAATHAVSASLGLVLPTGDEDIVGDDNDMDITIDLACSKELGSVNLHGNLGFTFWGEDDEAEDSNISYGVAVEYPMDGLSLTGEVRGTNVEDADDKTPLTLHGGIKYVVNDNLDIEGTIGFDLSGSDWQDDLILGAGVVCAF